MGSWMTKERLLLATASERSTQTSACRGRPATDGTENETSRSVQRLTVSGIALNPLGRMYAAPAVVVPGATKYRPCTVTPRSPGTPAAGSIACSVGGGITVRKVRWLLSRPPLSLIHT